MKKSTYILALFSFCSLFFLAQSAFAGDLCPQGEAREDFIAYKLCVWQDIGPAKRLVWGSGNNSRGEIRKELYGKGVLNVGEFPIVIGLRGLKPNARVVLFGTTKTGRVEKREETSSKDGELNIVLRTQNGEGTLWVSRDALTGAHFVKLWSQKTGIKLGYNHPDERFFTKPGEDVRLDGTPRYPATRLNTKVPPH